MEKTVLSKEEIENLSSLQQQQDTFIIQLGQIEYQKNLLDKQQHITKQQIELSEVQYWKRYNSLMKEGEEFYKQQIESFENEQIQLAKQLEEKYGKGTVNLESGEFIKA